MSHSIQSLIKAWQQVDYKKIGLKGIHPNQTSDPSLLAGCYLEWANGSLEGAIHRVKIHASGLYLDCPRFNGCDETLILLEDLNK